MKHNLSILFILILIAGCATTEGYRNIVESWVGSSEVDLIRSWGPPQQSYESGGTKFLVYNSSRNVYLPGTSPTYTTTVIGNTAYTNSSGGTPARNLNFSCETTFEISSNRIVSWSFRGNDCKADPNRS